VPFEVFDAGVLDGQPLRYPISVHGPVIGTATVDGAPVALTSKRSTFGRDGLNLGALKNMTEGDAATVEGFYESANRFGFTFNWGYANRDGIAYFASGELPVRAPGLDRRLPTLGTGDYEWQGFLDQDEHPHGDTHPSGRLLNWNNKSAPGFMHGDGTQYGSVHRVENFDQWPDDSELTDVVAVMNRAATEDEAASVWPVISATLAEGEAPSPLAEDVVAMLDEWVADDAPWLDADEDGFVDDAPGPLIYEDLLVALGRATVEPVLAEVLADDIPLEGIDAASFIDKELRTVLGGPVEGPFNVSYCGAGDLASCAESLWAAVDEVAAQYAAEYGDDVSTWRREGPLIGFQPGLIPEQFRATNRPTYQQVLEFAPS
jgi:acyl-homoserine lactone acylase PvdQ